jgi:uncharacterized integral membrane protein
MMRQINFLLIFIFCLALVIFGIRNTDPVTIHLIPGLDIQPPLSIALILALGLGAVLAWVFSLWVRLQQGLESLPQKRKIKQQEQRIKQQEESIQTLKQELEKVQANNQPQLPPEEEKDDSSSRSSEEQATETATESQTQATQ